MNPEARLEQKFNRAVQAVGGRTFKLLPTVAGMPDRMVVLPPGTIYLVELKTTTGKLSPIQEHWHGELKKLGVTVHTIYGDEGIQPWLGWASDEAWYDHLAAEENQERREKMVRRKSMQG